MKSEVSWRLGLLLAGGLSCWGCQQAGEAQVAPSSRSLEPAPVAALAQEPAGTEPASSGRLSSALHLAEAGEKARDPEVAWCASGGAPVVGQPVFDAQERAYVATSDGYLHAFERDGRYRWSYTVKGTPLGSVSLRPHDGVILMGTTASLVYAISQSGTLYWRFSTMTPVWSGLLALNPETVVFLGLDERLYALANTGRARYRVRAPGTPMGGPVVASNDVVWVPLANGVARFRAAYQLEHFPLPSAAEQLLTLGKRAVARAGGRAYLLESGEPPRDLGEAQSLAGDGRRVLVLSDSGNHQSLMVKEAQASRDTSAAVGQKASLSFELSDLNDAPALAGERLWLPGKAGRLRIRQLGSGKEQVIRVGDSDLKAPLVSASGERAILADSLGRFCVIDLSRSEKFVGN